MNNVVCVLAQGRDGVEYDLHYVRRLHFAVKNNTTKPFLFTCLCDYQAVDDYLDQDELESDGIIVKRLKHEWSGWWAKLELFRRGAFTDRIIYLDLDTVIYGNIDFLFDYKGEFAILRDFHLPDQYGSAIMLFDPHSRKVQDIYNKFQPAAQEIMRAVWKGSDQDWIRACLPPDEVDYVQTLYPLEVAGYHRDRASNAPPAGSSLVCFYGPYNKPHKQPAQHWTFKEWTKYDTIDMKVDAPPVRYGEIEEQHDKIVVIGSGPSLKDVNLTKINDDVKIIAVNAAVEHIPRADYFFTMDPSPENKKLLRNQRRETKYYAAVYDVYGTRKAPRYWREARERNVTFLRRMVDLNNRNDRIPYGMSDQRNGVHTGNSGFGAFQMARMMGAKKILLLGIDGGKGYAWSDGHPSNLFNLKGLFDMCVKQIENGKVEVKVGSPESVVDCWERVTPEEGIRWINES